MATEICKLCGVNSTPWEWVESLAGHVCQSCSTARRDKVSDTAQADKARKADLIKAWVDSAEGRRKLAASMIQPLRVRMEEAKREHFEEPVKDAIARRERERREKN